MEQWYLYVYSEFLRGKEEYLPGLLKQETRSYEFLAKYAPLDVEIFKIMHDFLIKYSSRMKIFAQLLQNCNVCLILIQNNEMLLHKEMIK